MKKHFLLYFIGCLIGFLLIISGNLWGQDAAPPLEPALLERPNYLTIIKIDNNSEDLLGIIADSVVKYGFDIIQNDLLKQQIEAEKHDVDDPRDYDKIIIWLERDYQRPSDFVKVYMLCGRFIHIIGGTTGTKRIKITEAEENQRFKKIKSSILSISK